MENQRWWEMRWPSRHAIATPFGVFAVTALLTRWISGQWLVPDNGALASDLVALAGVIYGMMALTVEGGVRLMFWAWEKHQAVRESLREEGRVEGREKGREEMRSELTPAIKQRDQVLARVAEEKGLTLEELLEQEGVK